MLSFFAANNNPCAHSSEDFYVMQIHNRARAVWLALQIRSILRRKQRPATETHPASHYLKNYMCHLNTKAARQSASLLSFFEANTKPCAHSSEISMLCKCTTVRVQYGSQYKYAQLCVENREPAMETHAASHYFRATCAISTLTLPDKSAVQTQVPDASSY